MISSTTTNYSNRTVDIHILKGTDVTLPNAQPVNVCFGKPSSFCTGVQKLVQRYAISLLTVLGSQIDFNGFGTTLLVDTNMSGLQTISDLTHLFNFANLKVTTDFRQYQATLANGPLDEQLNAATLTDISVSGDSVSMSVTITTMAGSDIPFVIPLPVQ